MRPPHHIRFYLLLRPPSQRRAPCMSKPHASTDDRLEPRQYEIRLQGHLDTRWAAWFDGLSLAHQSDGTTVIYGSVVDQAALHGLLSKVRDLGLPLIAVTQLDSKQMKGRER